MMPVTMKKPIAILLCLALAAGAFYTWQPWSTAPALTSELPEPAADTNTPENSSMVEPGNPPGEAVTAPSTQRTKIEAEPITKATPDGILLRVIDGVTREPVSRPTIHVLRPSELNAEQLSQLREMGPPGPQIYAVTEEFGSKRHGDTKGEIWLPAIIDKCIISCNHETKRGLLRPRSSSRAPLILELHTDHRLKVLVQDQSGIPQSGIPVALRIASEQGFSRSVSQSDTDNEGVATIANWQQLMRIFRGGEAPNEAEIVISLPLAKQPSAKIDLLDPPSETTVLTLPPTGSVEVVLDYPDRNKLADAKVWFTSAKSSPQDEWSMAGSSHIEQTSERGRAVFEHVGLSLQLHVRAQLSGGNLTA